MTQTDIVRIILTTYYILQMWFQEIWCILLSTKNMKFESVLLVKKNENWKTIIEFESTCYETNESIKTKHVL